MTRSPVLTTLTLTATAVAGGILAATPASAGGIGDFLSPAFGNSCTNHNARSHTDGATTTGAGAANSNLVGLPLASPRNQCGGADLHGVPIGIL